MIGIHTAVVAVDFGESSRNAVRMHQLLRAGNAIAGAGVASED
jgi:hypothetical protein